ncbi:MAG: recombinase family protein [Actinomycetota bacterium]|nr:recombinase family protein [Actinomycetota bacterium]
MAQRRAGVYVRISEDRALDALGVKRQESDSRKLAKERGWKVVGVYTDNDTSAYAGKPRPGYESLLGALRSHEINAVVAWHPDRLYRHPRDLETFVETVEAAGATVATVSAGELDLGTASGRMVARLLGATARYESEKLSERQRRKMEEVAASGRPHGGPRIFGWDRDPDTGERIVVEAEAELVREGARWVLGGMSPANIAESWNELRDLEVPGFGTFGTTKGARWSTTGVRRMLMRPANAGLRVFRGEVIGDASWPPLLDRQTWEAVNAALKPKPNGGPRARRYLLTGLMVCTTCQAPMRGHTSSKSRGYACSVCERRIAAGKTDELVCDLVLAALDTPELAKMYAAAQSSTDEAAALAEVREAEERLRTLSELFAAGHLSRDEWDAGRKVAVDRREAAERKLNREPGPRALAESLSTTNLGALWDDRDDGWRRELMRVLIDRIEVSPAEMPGRWEPQRLSVKWRA